MIAKQTQIKLDQLANKFAAKLLEDVKAVLGSPQYKNTGELEDSVKVTVSKASDTEAPTIVLTYADQGFYLGYKNPQWTKLPNIEKIKKWLAARGLIDGDIPGYTYGSASKLTEEQKISRVAWAIAKNKRKEDTWKPKRWKNAAKLGDLLRSLNQETISAYSKDMEMILADAISTGTILS